MRMIENPGNDDREQGGAAHRGGEEKLWPAAERGRRDRGGGERNEEAEIMRESSDDRDAEERGETAQQRAIAVAPRLHNANAQAGDDHREKEQNRVGTRFLRVLYGSWRQRDQQHQRQARAEAFGTERQRRRGDGEDAEDEARCAGSQVRLAERRKPPAHEEVVERRMRV